MKRFKLALNFQLNNKLFKYNILLISLAFLIILLVNMYSVSANNYLEKKSYNNSIWFQSFEVVPLNNKELDSALAEVLEIPHIVNAIKYYEYSAILHSEDLINKKMSGDLIFYFANNDSLPSITYGSNFPNEVGNYLICPEALYASSGFYNLKYMNRKYVLNSKDYLHKELDFNYISNHLSKTFNEKFKIIGLYVPRDANDFNVCFTQNENLTRIVTNQYSDDIDILTGESRINEQFSLYVQIDDLKNLEEVKENLESLGYSYSPTAKIINDYYNDINSSTLKITIIVNVIMFLLIFLIFLKQYKDEKNFLNLLNVLGYQKSDIIKISSYSSIILLIVSIFIANLIFLIVYIIGSLVVYYYPFILNGWQFVVNYKSIFSGIITLFLLTMVINTVKFLRFKVR